MVSRQPQSKPDKSFFPQAVPARQPMADIYVRLPDLAVPRMGRQKWRLPVPIASTVSRLRRPFTNWVNPAVRYLLGICAAPSVGLNYQCPVREKDVGFRRAASVIQVDE